MAAEDHPALQVAFGGFDVAVFLMAGPWDLAAPSLVVEEAGGRFSDLNGAATLTAGAVFSNGALHDATLDCLRVARSG
jgi:histidinol-phosphatase